jgi:DUF971 family protein
VIRVGNVTFDGALIRLSPNGCASKARARRGGHSPSQRKIVAIEPVGNYAIKIAFDGHNSGLYSWDCLRKLAM